MIRRYLAHELDGLVITDRGRDVGATVAGLGFLGLVLAGLSTAGAIVGPF
mgnify:CR=1 FL=1